MNPLSFKLVVFSTDLGNTHAASSDTTRQAFTRATPSLRGYAYGDRQELSWVRCDPRGWRPDGSMDPVDPGAAHRQAHLGTHQGLVPAIKAARSHPPSRNS